MAEGQQQASVTSHDANEDGGGAKPEFRCHMLQGEPERGAFPDGHEIGGSAPLGRVHPGPTRRKLSVSRSLGNIGWEACRVALRLRPSILSTVLLSRLVNLLYDLPDGFGLDMPASLHRGPGDSGPSRLA